MSIYGDIAALVGYALENGLISDGDCVYTTNRLIDILALANFKDEAPSKSPLSEVLTRLCRFAAERGIISDDTESLDRFDTRLMGALTPPPSVVRSCFEEHYSKSPDCATDWFYRFSQDTNYIRRDRSARDIRWQTDTEYGALDITINLAKPEKDPRAIAAAKLAPQSDYPKCMLCRECEGYAGRTGFPARQNHRIIPIDICGEHWNFQYSPYVYYNEHCIAFNDAHVPMKIDRAAFAKLMGFLDVFPHYFIGSNADLPIVGGSILSHEHFQGGRYVFAMERAPIEKLYSLRNFSDIEIGRARWPLSVLRLCGSNPERLTELAEHVLDSWRVYTDEASFIFSETDGVPHNTITPIARRRGGKYELDLVLRNNITTDEHPLGVFHPHAEYHHIKRENIGLIEVMGLAVLPPRIKAELSALVACIETGGDMTANPLTAKHAEWAKRMLSENPEEADLNALFRREVGLVFLRVLECAGVFKRTVAGNAAFDAFAASLDK